MEMKCSNHCANVAFPCSRRREEAEVSLCRSFRLLTPAAASARKVLFGLSCLLGFCFLAVGVSPASAAPVAPRPNIIFILADDLGYGEIGCYGQQIIQTPRIDQMAREGMRFTQFYAGATVCAPSRSVLMTGQHQGRTRVRGNAGRANPLAQSLRSNDVTVAKVLQAAGYRTALIGKWGLGDAGVAEQGLPRRHGFDYFFGFLNQHHAHNHYPDFLWRNEEKVSLPNDLVPVGDQGGGYARHPKVYADDLFADEAVKFIGENRARPFFLFLSLVVPHANNERNRELKDGAEVPDYGPYADKPWPAPNKGHAAMITRMDGYVGRVLDELKRLQLDERTLVVFTSDNGPHKESGNSVEFFNASGPLRGLKRDLTDGGIRVPFIAWWPGTVKANKVSEHVGYFGDFMATAAELAGAPLPATPLDSISFVPALLGKRGQKKHEWLYFEFHEGGFKSAAILNGRWKGIRTHGDGGPPQVYDLQKDIGETRDVAARAPVIASRIASYLDTARTDSPNWPVRPPAAQARPQRQRAAASSVKPRVLIETALGPVEVELDASATPATVTNFLRYVSAGLYDGGVFHRTVTLSNQPADKVKIEVIQASANPARTNEFLPPIVIERTRDTGLKHLNGTISMARDGPDTAQDEFFICIGDQPELDFGGKRNPDGQGFAAFGKVTKGMDVVRRIQASPAQGQNLTPPVRIERAVRLN
jgi:arylsulfatase A-like enzyme/cyclophilin family peptidyl-prolyl cis-trans isomerase